MADKPRLPLLGTQTNREHLATEDSRLINGFAEKDALGELWVYKRPGLTQLYNVADGVGRGLYYGSGQVYHIAGNTLYNNSSSVSAVSGLGEGYTFHRTDYTAPYIIKNSAIAYTFDGVSTLTQIADADYPSTTVPGCATVNGTTYVMEESGAIYGSAVGDPTSWDPTNVIQANAEPGFGIYLVKLLNFVVALKQFSIQFFYDAGNATGSPLTRYEGPSMTVGCYSYGTVQCAEDKLFWVAQSKISGPSVWMFDKLTPAKISTPAIDRLFIQEGMFSLRSWLMRISGHLLYGIKLSTPSITIVYDVGEKLWYLWSGTDDLAWPIVDSVQGGNLPIVQHALDGTILSVDPRIYQDNGADFSWELYTPNADLGIATSKTLHRMWFIGDQVPGSLLSIRHNDDDYDPAKWSQPRIVDLGRRAPNIRDEGSFYRRAYHFKHRRNTPLRLQAIELDVEPGFF